MVYLFGATFWLEENLYFLPLTMSKCQFGGSISPVSTKNKTLLKPINWKLNSKQNTPTNHVHKCCGQGVLFHTLWSPYLAGRLAQFRIFGIFIMAIKF